MVVSIVQGVDEVQFGKGRSEPVVIFWSGWGVDERKALGNEQEDIHRPCLVSQVARAGLLRLERA